MALSFVPLGVGNAFSAKHYSTCLAIEAEGRWLLVECPHPIRKMMAESGAGIDVGDVMAVVITHLHADHSAGLEGLAFFNHFTLQRRTCLLLHPDVADRLWEGHLAGGMERLMLPFVHTIRRMELEDYFELRFLSQADPVRVGPFRIESRKTIHHVPTTALRIHAGGRSLGYSADTTFDRSLIDWLSEADLILHETGSGLHTSYRRLRQLPADLRARMRLIHYPDEFDCPTSAIECLQQGRRYHVMPSRHDRKAA